MLQSKVLNWASADFDGKFRLTQRLVLEIISFFFLGFEPKTVKFSVVDGATKNLGTIVLTSNSNELDEIVVTSSILDIAKDRKLLLQFLQSKHQKFKKGWVLRNFRNFSKHSFSICYKTRWRFWRCLIFVDLTKEI
jgi:hypothetical protein